MRRLHGARPLPHRRARQISPHGRAPAARHKLCRTQAFARLPHSEAQGRTAVFTEAARPRVPLFDSRRTGEGRSPLHDAGCRRNEPWPSRSQNWPDHGLLCPCNRQGGRLSLTRAIMLQGTGSNVGKSLIAAGLARAFANRGLKVRPFKPQNMSNNAAVTVDGGEIGRAQALQAVAARVPPSVHMNPVLLKPESPTGAQVIVQGQRRATLKARDFMRTRREYLPQVMESFHKLCTEADLVIVEGAGSPAEINLRDGDIANMGFAEAAGIDVILVGDVHRGGVIASIVGTFKVLSRSDAARLKAVLINNFHGDMSLFGEGRKIIEKLTRRPVLGVIPHFAAARRLPAEDALALEETIEQGGGGLKIAVLRLPRIANFDDLDPLRLEPGVTLHFVQAGETVPADAKLVIIPGSKSTIADLVFLKIQGWDIDLRAHMRRGGRVLGICGGYQMLGRVVHDPGGLEGPPGSAEGLGLLDVETILSPRKELTLV